MQTSLPVETSPMTNTMYTVNSHLRQGMAAGGQDYPNSMGLGGFGSSYAFTNWWVYIKFLTTKFEEYKR